MSSRHGAGRPNRNGETFARTHHHDNNQGEPSSTKFDVRNPSILAPDARDDDAILDADVIGSSAATKRGAVNLDGYDSDSDNDTFNTRAESRKKGKVDINEQLDNYDSKSTYVAQVSTAKDDDDDDMFAPADDDDDEKKDGQGEEETSVDRKKKKVQFVEAADIQGQEERSKSGGRIRLDEEESSDDESDKELAALEEDIDEEVGAGGLKRNAPKIEAFNLREEMEEGRFDDQGNYVRKAGDPDAVHDSWLNGLSKKDVKKAAEAHERRETEARRRRLEDDGVRTADLLRTLIVSLERAETPLEALARLGKGKTKTKKVPMWKLKKMNKGMDVEQDAEKKQQQEADAEQQARIKATIDDITEAADKLMGKGYEEIYEQEREMLVRDYRRETGEEWVEPAREDKGAKRTTADESRGTVDEWEFRWVDGRDDASKQGPFKGSMMKAWCDAGYFEQGVEFRLAGGSEEWSKEVPAFV